MRIHTLALMLLGACATPTAETQATQVTGRTVSGSNEGTVDAWRADSGDDVTLISTASATISQDGRYTLQLDGRSSEAFVVEAHFDDGTTARVLVSGAADADGEVIAAPMSVETSAEADIYADVTLAEVDHSGAVLRAFVDAEAAAAWATMDDTARAAYATSVSASVQAWIASDADSGAIDAWAQVTADADAEADAAGDGVDEGLDALAATWEAAGATSADLAYATTAALRAEISVSGHSEADAALREDLDSLRGTVVARLVAEADAAFGSSSALDIDAAVSATLSGDGGSLLAALSVDTEASIDLGAAWTAAEAGAATVSARILTAAATDADSVGEIAADALVDYRTDVELAIAADLEAGGHFDEAQANALASLLAQAALTTP